MSALVAFDDAKPTVVKDLDILEKRRLACRTFGFQRHTVYRTKSLVEAPRETCDYAPEEDRLNKDFDSSLRAANDARKNKQERQRVFQGVRQAYRNHKLHEEREKQWERKIQNDYFLSIKDQRRNKGGAPYNIISKEYDDTYDGHKLQYEEELAKWRAGLRRIRIQSKMSGTRNLNVITWHKARQMEVPAKPKPFPYRSPPRPASAPPEPSKMPIVAVDAARPISAVPLQKTDASKDYQWDLYHYVQKPYKFK